MIYAFSVSSSHDCFTVCDRAAKATLKSWTHSTVPSTTVWIIWRTAQLTRLRQEDKNQLKNKAVYPPSLLHPQKPPSVVPYTSPVASFVVVWLSLLHSSKSAATSLTCLYESALPAHTVGGIRSRPPPSFLTFVPLSSRCGYVDLFTA